VKLKPGEPIDEIIIPALGFYPTRTGGIGAFKYRSDGDWHEMRCLAGIGNARFKIARTRLFPIVRRGAESGAFRAEGEDPSAPHNDLQMATEGRRSSSVAFGV